MSYTTYEFTAYTEADLLAAGAEGHSVNCGDTFTMSGTATTCFEVSDNDAFLSGDNCVNENANDQYGQQAEITDAATGAEIGNGGQIYAEKYFWVSDDAGNWYVMLQIEQEGTNEDYFTFFNGYGYETPAEGTELTVYSSCNVTSDWVDYKCLDAGEKGPDTGSISGRVFCDDDCDGIDGGVTVIEGEDYTIEAEDMDAWGFKTVSGANASGGELVKLQCAGQQAAIKTDFTGKDGVYDVSLFIQDETDGQSKIKLLVNGQVVEAIRLDNDSNGVGSNSGGFSEFVIEGVELNAGDEIKLWAEGDGYEFVRIDKLEFNGRDQEIRTEEPGKEGVVVVLLDADGNEVLDGNGDRIETTTDANGEYTFDGVPVGDYRVKFENPDGTEFTFQNAGSNDAIDSDVDVNGVSDVVTVVADQTTSDVDAGLKPAAPPPSVVCLDFDEICIDENTTAVIDLGAFIKGEGNPDLGKDICIERDRLEDETGVKTTKPVAVTLTLGDALTDAINSTQGDKLEVGAVGTDSDPDGNFLIRVSKDEDFDDLGEIYFEGEVRAGQSFTALAAAAGRSEFGSETFVHIINEETGELIQTINFHTSCSAPLVIGDQYGSVSLQAVTVENKDTGEPITFGGEADGVADDGITYSIVGGDDAALFEVDADTGEVSFINAPDFEAPADANGDNFYEVTVRAEAADGGFIEKTLPIEVKDVDDDPLCIDENTTFVVDLDLTVDCPVDEPKDLGLEICAERDRLKDEEGIELNKPSELTLTLGDALDTTPSAFQTGGKSEVGALQGAEDGDGLLRVIVSGDEDPTDTSEIYFDDAVSFGDSFTALASNAGETDFRSNTYVHILDDDGTVLQTIRLHTSCSSPIVIGDQFGTVTLSGVGLEDKNTGEVMQFGGVTSTPVTLGEGDIVYSIAGGADAALFEVDADTGEVSFRDAPDFENPGDAGGDNIYNVVVRAAAKDDLSKFVEEPLVVEVKDVDETGSIAGRYFCDENRDGAETDAAGNFEAGVAGATVWLILQGSGVIASTTTDGDGNYSFTDLEAGNYTVRFEDPDDVSGATEGKNFIAADQGDDATDSDVVNVGGAGNGNTATITLAAGENKTDVDAGIEQQFMVCDDPDAVLIDFEGLDGDVGFEAFEAGRVIDNEYAQFGVTITAQRASNNDPANDAMVFDSANPTGGDPDLQTFNQGNLLIVSEDNDSSDPDDAVGGVITFDFENPSRIFDLKVVDTEEGGMIELFDADGNSLGVIDLPNLADGGLEQVMIDVDGVSQMVVTINGSGAIDDICIVPGEPAVGSLSGRYFFDADRDGLDNDGANGISGIQVELLDENGVPTGDTATTDAMGNYSFGNLSAGDYGVKFTDPDTGRELTTQNVDMDASDDIDSDAADVGGGMSAITGITVVAGQDTPNNDAGVVDLAGSLSGTYFCDDNRDGDDDGAANGDADIAGKTVMLFEADGVTPATDINGNLVAAQITDAQGDYSFENLAAGDYVVMFEATDGKEFIAANAAADDVDSDVVDAANGKTAPVTVNAGEETTDVDAGVVELLGSLSGRYFCDSDGDGFDNDGDVPGPGPGIEGIRVDLLDVNGQPTSDFTFTAADGSYSFDNLSAGTYGVQFAETPPTKDFTTTNADNDVSDAIDSDAVANGDGTATISIITVVGGQDTPDNDVGVAPLPGSLSGRYFFDADRDGLDNDGVNGISGIQVELLDGNGVPTGATVMTDAQGNYSFGNLDAGTYGVKFTDPDTGRELTTQNVGMNDAIDSDASEAGNGMSVINGITVAAGTDTPNNDAGVVEKPGSLSGTYFCDDDRDNVDDGAANGDADIAGKMVMLFEVDGVTPATDIDGNPVAAQVTDAQGNYRFTNLAAGNYVVMFEAVVDKPFAAPNVGDDADDSDVVDAVSGKTAPVTVVAGEETTDVDAGVFPNQPPVVVDDAGVGCADELIFVDFSDNFSDPDAGVGDTASVTAINGQTISQGNTISVSILNDGGETKDVNVTLTADNEFIFDGEDAFAFLDIGEQETESFTVTVTDSIGASSQANIDVTFKGDANSVSSFESFLPTSATYQLEYALDGTSPFQAFAFDLTIVDADDDRFDGVVFEEAYCLDFDTAVRTLGDDPGTVNIGATFGSQSAAALSAFDPNTVSNANGLAGSDNLDRINWIVAQDFESQGFSGWAVQFSIWELADNFNASLVDYDLFLDTELADVQEILDVVDGALNPAIEGFEFSTGDTIGMILDPGDSDPDNVQPFIVGVDWETYDCLC